MPHTSGTTTPPESSAYRSSEHSIDGVLHSGQSAPPNTPASQASLSPQAARHYVYGNSTSLNLIHSIDLRTLNYCNTVDENLVCPICRCPLIEPVTTSCDHTFCSTCLEEALSQTLQCPIDRSKLDPNSLQRSPKILYNQLDSLKVACPCCEASVSRALLEGHIAKYCPEGLIRCPGKNMDQGCTEKIKRKLEEHGCLHYIIKCPDCEFRLFKADLERHRATACKERHNQCSDCGVSILRCQEAAHAASCPETLVACRWVEYGCMYEGKRKEVQAHIDSCLSRSLGLTAESLKREMSSLKSEVRVLTETNRTQERRIKFLEGGWKMPDHAMDLSELSSQTFPSITGTRDLEQLTDEYIITLSESLEHKQEQLSTGMTELEARLNALVFNENMAVKNELAEIRSMQQTTSMHVRWLMKFRIQENTRRAGGIGSNGTSQGEGSDGAGSSGDSLPSRRTSDSSSRDLITKL